MKFAPFALAMVAKLSTASAAEWDQTDGPYARCKFTEGLYTGELFMTQTFKNNGKARRTTFTGSIRARKEDTSHYWQQFYTDNKCTTGSEYGGVTQVGIVSQPRRGKHKILGRFRNVANEENGTKDRLEDLDGYSVRLIDDEGPLSCCTIEVKDQDCTDASTPGCGPDCSDASNPGCGGRRMLEDLEDMFDQI